MKYEEVDPARYFAVMDAHPDRFEQLQKLLVSNPKPKVWRKLTAHLDQWKDEEALRDVVWPMVRQDIRHWNAHMGIGVLCTTPSHWKQRFLKEGKPRHLAIFRELSLRSLNGSSALLKRLLESQDELSHVTALDLSHDGIEADESWQRFCSELSLPELTELRLEGNAALGDEGVRILLESPWLEQLRKLNLRSCSLTDESALAIASSPGVCNLSWIDLGQNDLTTRGGEALDRSEHFQVSVLTHSCDKWAKLFRSYDNAWSYDYNPDVGDYEDEWE